MKRRPAEKWDVFFIYLSFKSPLFLIQQFYARQPRWNYLSLNM